MIALENQENQNYKDHSLKESPCGQNALFPVTVFLKSCENTGEQFSNHWHNHLEFLYVKSGKGIFGCDHVTYPVEPGDLIVVNSGELHYGCSMSNTFSYYCIIVDPLVLQSSLLDICDLKYIGPITQNLILFHNRIEKDIAVLNCINSIISEYENGKIGYELSIKSCINQMLVLLIREHVKKMLSPSEQDGRRREIERLSVVFKYIETNYTEKIIGSELARMINVSLYHFSRIFKKMTSMTITEYINIVRIRRAAYLLCSSNLNISEIALSVGFNDLNYFSRQYKKQLGVSPSQFRTSCK